MREYIVNSVKSQIWLSNGIYAFLGDSAEGKSYLYEMLRQASWNDEAVLAITYGTVFLDKADIIARLKERKYNDIMLDRFYLYQTKEIVKVLGELSYDTTIMLDLKGPMYYCNGIVADCFIRLSSKLLEVLPV